MVLKSLNSFYKCRQDKIVENGWTENFSSASAVLTNPRSYGGKALRSNSVARREVGLPPGPRIGFLVPGRRSAPEVGARIGGRPGPALSAPRANGAERLLRVRRVQKIP